MDETVQSSASISAAKKLEKAKSLLSVKHPYFGMLASKLEHKEHESITTYASNGRRFLYRASFIDACTIDELLFVLSNCVMHHILAHQQRKLHRKGNLWQLATDFAINDLLVRNKFTLPHGANYDKAFSNMYAEEIYEAIKESYDSSTNSFDAQQEAQTFSAVGRIDAIDDDSVAQSWHYAQTVANEVGQKRSTIPVGMHRLAAKVESNRVDWRFELFNAINRHMRNNYAFMPPNKKHLARGFVLPSLSSDTLSLCVAIDTSGSINESLLGLFVAEFTNIMEQFASVRIDLVLADARIQGHYTFYGSLIEPFALKGGGGTDYRVVFDYIQAKLPSNTMLLYFTDGDGFFPKYAPSYEVIWALSRPRRIPFGRSIVLL